MPRFHRAFALIGLLLLTQAEAAEKLRLVADAWPPFTDATLVNGGVATDIVSQVEVGMFLPFCRQLQPERGFLFLGQRQH